MTTRRQFLQGAGCSLLTPFAVLAARPQAPSTSTVTDPASVFGLSVASGDPSPTGVVLWTRVNPEAWSPQTPLRFEVARDAEFRRPVLAGEIAAAEFAADRDYTVRVDLQQHLAPQQRYYYRFWHGAVSSRTGRCRTAPQAGATLSSLRLGVVTCQDFTNGYYAAFAQLAQEDVDFVLHLGDAIYETTGAGFQRQPYPDRVFSLPSGQPAAVNLSDFRFLYRKYRSDPLFQQALEQHTFIFQWDDHETANDCYWDYVNDTLGAPDHPYAAGDPEQLRQLKRDAQQAWFEYIPARVTFQPNAAHPFETLSIYRRFTFGQLADVFVTDQRTYRSPHPCGLEERVVTRGCSDQNSELQTMLGETQRDWFIAGVTSSNAQWKIWSNETFLGQFKLGRRDGQKLFINLDAWDGYENERAAILSAIAAAGVQNFIALTGDFHSYMAAYLKVDYSQRSNRPGPNLVGVEFMTPAVTSSTLIDLLLTLLPSDDLAELQAEEARQPSKFYFENLAKFANPHVQFFNSQEWGYSIVEFTPESATYSAYSVAKSINSAVAPRRLIRQIRVPSNRITMQDVV